MTKREMFKQIMAHLTDTAEINFIENEIKLLDKKSSSRKPTERQAENERFKGKILELLADGEYRTISEIQSEIAEIADLSGQRVSAMLTQLVNGEYVSKRYEKRKAYFGIEI